MKNWMQDILEEKEKLFHALEVQGNFEEVDCEQTKYPSPR